MQGHVPTLVAGRLIGGALAALALTASAAVLPASAPSALAEPCGACKLGDEPGSGKGHGKIDGGGGSHDGDRKINDPRR